MGVGWPFGIPLTALDGPGSDGFYVDPISLEDGAKELWRTGDGLSAARTALLGLHLPASLLPEVAVSADPLHFQAGAAPRGADVRGPAWCAAPRDQPGGMIDGEQLFSAKELTVYPGQKVTVKDNGANSIICVQGEGRINQMRLSSPKMIGFHDLIGVSWLLRRRLLPVEIEVK